MKQFDKIETVICEQKQNERKPHTPVKMPVKPNCKYFESRHQPRQCPKYGEKCVKCDRMNHFWEVCWSARGRALHNIKQELDKEEENHIDMVDIDSINFNSKHSIITANLKTPSML